MKLGDFEKAFEIMREAESSAPKAREKEDFRNKDFYMEFAFIADKAKKTDTTERILQDLLKEYPDDANLNNFLGYLWAENNKNLDQAEKLIRKSLDKEPENSAYLDSMAWVFYRKKDYETALEYIEESLKNIDSPLPDAVISDHAGDIYHALGKKEEALKYWKLSFETYSTDTDPEKIKEKIDSLEKKE